MAVSNQRLQASINVTPMIDVLLVLLIIFMAITPVSQRGLDAVIPQRSDESRARPPENPVVLSIGADGSYELNSEPIAANGLAKQLDSVFALRGQRVLFVRAAEELEFQTVATAFDTARDAGIDRIAMMPRE